ncbi:ThiF family adenylyltransferase [Thermocatellispora tengchongensis]|uniref:ThiF family adenylyltransferase n=1 Tax=Thermocatellispora tengchongensis TaxID=1073253 RepID=UPI0035E45E5D
MGRQARRDSQARPGQVGHRGNARPTGCQARAAHRHGRRQSVAPLPARWPALGLGAQGQASHRGIDVRSRESADTSPQTRQLRAGVTAEGLANAKIAVVGCGAVGSFAAGTLFRSGVRHLTLIDYERLRPGNVVGHLAAPVRSATGRSRPCGTALPTSTPMWVASRCGWTW